jgi:heptosyltransferase-3
MRGNKLFKFLDFYIGIPLIVLFSLLRPRGKGAILNDIEARRILIIKFVALGDAVLLIPSLRAIRKKFPKAEIIFLGTHLTGIFLHQFPEYIDQFITIDIGKLVRRPMYFWHTMGHIRSLQCDVAVDFEQWPRLSALFAAMSGAAVRLGFKTKGQYRHAAFTHVVDRDSSQHEVDNFLSLARFLTNEPSTRALEIKVDDAALVRAQSFLVKNGRQKDVPVVVVHPGCGTHGFPREWPPQNYAALLNRLNAEHEMLVVITGTRSEVDVMNAVSQAVKRSQTMYMIDAHDDFVALLSMASLVISANNGAMHLAAALQVPQIALHGPTNAVQWGPLNARAVVIRSRCPKCPCLDLGFEYHRQDGYCMEQLDVEEVYQNAKQILGK